MPPRLRLPRRMISSAFLSMICLLLVLSLAASPASALRVNAWNVLNVSSTNNATSRVTYMRTVLQQIDPDVLVTEEMIGLDGAQYFYNNVLQIIEPGQWTMAPFVNGPDTDNACYYRTSLLDYVGMVTLHTALRDISGWIFRPDGYTSSAAEFRVYALHLKASSGSDNENKRLAEATILRNHLNSLPAGTHFIIGGDYNLYSSSEPAWGELTGSQSDNDGRVFDPVNRVGSWHNNSSYVDVHSQSPRVDNLGDGGSTGGMDDRFDFLLANDDMLDNSGIAYLSGSYTTYGQDGNHFNKNITDSPTIPEGSTVANALFRASDHLPLFLDIQVPARLQITGTADFGRVLQGSTAVLSLTVQNPAIAPAEDLSYSVTASSGFSGPASTSPVAPGGQNLAAITAETSSPAALSGQVTFSTNAVDDPTAQLPASATVLRPAAPSVHSDVIVLSEAADFGSHLPGEFTDISVAAHNVGFDSLQALLNVYDWTVTGTDAAKFGVVSFTAAEVGATGATFQLHFDDSGAATGSTYVATLHLKTRDEQGVLGASARSDLNYDLSAFVENSATPAPAIPGLTRLMGNHPNPFNPRTTIAFDLAREGRVQIAVYDLRGRRVVTLLDASRAAGSYSVVWNGADQSGRPVASGVYLYRLLTDGVDQTRSMALVR